MLDHARLFVLGADHVTGGVVQKDDRQVRLIAELEKLRRLGGAVRVDRAVVADDAAGLTEDPGLQADRDRAVTAA